MYGKGISEEEFSELSELMRIKGVEHRAFELLSELRTSEKLAVKDKTFLKSFIPPWASSEPLSGIDATFYGTGSFTGDMEVFERVVEIINR
jgi:hypothetical protein